MGENHFASIPSVAYGFVLLMGAVAYSILQKAIIFGQGSGSLIENALGRDWKGKSSIAFYVIGMLSAVWLPFFAQIIYLGVAIMWLVPDTRIERAINSNET